MYISQHRHKQARAYKHLPALGKIFEIVISPVVHTVVVSLEAVNGKFNHLVGDGGTLWEEKKVMIESKNNKITQSNR